MQVPQGLKPLIWSRFMSELKLRPPETRMQIQKRRQGCRRCERPRQRLESLPGRRRTGGRG